MWAYDDETPARTDNPMKILVHKGYSLGGYAEEVFHLHIRYLGNWDELYFRDFLMANPDAAAEYGNLKIRIRNDIENGIIERMPNGIPNGYAIAKSDFVKKYTDIAKKAYRGKYKP